VGRGMGGCPGPVCGGWGGLLRHRHAQTATLSGFLVLLKWQEIHRTIPPSPSSGAKATAARASPPSPPPRRTHELHRLLDTLRARSYRYGVSAYNSGGYSPYSNIASIVTSGPPAAPANLRATTLTRTSIGLTWTNMTPDQTDLRIERCKGSGCTNLVHITALAGHFHQQRTPGPDDVPVSRARTKRAGGFTLFKHRERANEGIARREPSRIW
jgi:hypothetical protein